MVLPGADNDLHSILQVPQGAHTTRASGGVGTPMVDKDKLEYDRRLRSIGKAIKTNQIKESDGTTMSPATKVPSDAKLSPNKPMLGTNTMYSMRVRQIMKQREKQVMMEMRQTYSSANRGQVD